jgi:hypothetical protein
MENKVCEMINTMEKLIAKGDAITAWKLQGEFMRVHNAQPRDSAERVAMANVWQKAMMKFN